MISRSMKSRKVSRVSTRVTGTSSALKIVAYSMPMTPAPTTVEAARHPRAGDHRVAVENVFVVERNVRRPIGRGADRNQDPLGGVDMLVAGRAGDRQLVRVEEFGGTDEGADAVALELMLQHLDLMLERHVQPHAEVGAVDLLLHPVGAAVEAALAPARQVERGLAQRLRRDRAGVDRNTADAAAILDYQH